MLGVNADEFDVGSIEEGDFFVKFKLRNKRDNFKWVLVAVYGVAQPEFKEKFLVELVQTCDKEKLPILVGVTSISSEILVKKIIISSMQGGLFCLTQLLMVWT